MGNATSFLRISVEELSRLGAEGAPAYVSLAKTLEDEGYLNHHEQVAKALGARPRLLGSLDSVGTFFEELDAAVRGANNPDALAFLLWGPSREDVRQHWERLPPSGQALARAGALVLRREEFLGLQDALRRTKADASIREDLQFVVEGPPPGPDELDVWLTQGSEPVELDTLPATRGPPPASKLRANSAAQFDRNLVIGLCVLGGLGVLAIIWQVFF